MFFGDKLDAELHGERLRDRLIATLLRIRDKSGRLARLTANQVQREYSRKCGRRNIVLKARQMGMSTWIAARFFVATITRRGTLTVLVAHDQRAAEEIFRIVRRFWENLPERLRTGALRTSHANVRQLVFPELDSEYRVESAADPDAGRGLTIQNLHASEVARWPRDAVATLASLRAAVAPGGEIVLESTPQGSEGCFYREWQAAELTGTVRLFFPWWWAGEYRLDDVALGALTEEEQALAAQHGLTREQIAFRRRLKADFRGLAKQEFAEDAESCFLASGECYFEKYLVEERLKALWREVERWEAQPTPWMFNPPQAGREYVIGVDVAEGTPGGDYSVAEVIDREMGLQCAELHGHFESLEFARRIAALAERYNGAMVAVERNGPGGTVLAHLEQSEYPNLYAHHSDRKNGYPNHSGTRPALLDYLAACFAADPTTIASPRLLREMRSFVRSKGGRPEAASGAHDDCVLAWAIALKAREEARPSLKRSREVAVASLN